MKRNKVMQQKVNIVQILYISHFLTFFDYKLRFPPAFLMKKCENPVFEENLLGMSIKYIQLNLDKSNCQGKQEFVRDSPMFTSMEIEFCFEMP